MMRGVVSQDREILFDVIVRGSNGVERTVSAVLDTGFNGFLTLPSTLVNELDLVYVGHAVGTLADGTSAIMERYRAIVEWHERSKPVYVLGGDGGPLLGMALLEGNRLAGEIIAGGAVTISALDE